MDWFEICIIVLCIVVILMIFACAVDSYITTRRYKKFYETTEDGKKLYYSRYMLDLLKIKKCSFIRNQMQLKDKIDEYIAYMPDDNENGENLRKLKLQYKCNIEELKRVNQKIEDLEKQIKKMVAYLPKKYKGILDYNWEIAKVEVKEEELICW